MSSDMRVIAEGLRFPEGPVALAGGDVIVTELERGDLVRVAPDGDKTVVAYVGGSPNGAAVGPDGKLYVANSGGWRWTHVGEMLIPGEHGVTPAEDYRGGLIQRVDPDTGAVETLYDSCDGRNLCAPNDLVFDSTGGFWFTDHGHMHERHRDRTGVLYARADGSAIREVIFPLDAPNGIGLSPDEKRVYVAETHTGRVYAWDVPEPGTVPPAAFGHGGQLMVGLPGMQLLDSLAVDAEGWVNVATIVNGGITSISPDGSTVHHTPLPDNVTTNICFGGDGLRTAYVTLSMTGRLGALEWPRPGLKLAYQ